jgi:hypothetical protein
VAAARQLTGFFEVAPGHLWGEAVFEQAAAAAAARLACWSAEEELEESLRSRQPASALGGR